MDIDIDVADNKSVRNILKCVRASMIENDDLIPHVVGIYIQDIPIDPITGLSAIPYNHADEYGFTKIDILNLNLLKEFKSKTEIRELLKLEPNWNLLHQEDCVSTLFHVSKHLEILKKVKPKSILELADVLALIRPNKKHLLNDYLKSPEVTRNELYSKIDVSDLRKSHAISYAMNIVLQLHLWSLNN